MRTKKHRYPIYLSKENFENDIESLQLQNEYKCCYGYIKDFNRDMYSRTSHREIRTEFEREIA